MHHNFLDKKNSHLTLGGTFDRFHLGHEYFLKKAINLSNKITIGITSDSYAQKIHKDPRIQLFKKRRSQVQSFLDNYPKVVFQIIKLNNIYGPTIKNPSINSLLVTNNTIKNAERINYKRSELKKEILKIHHCRILKAEDGIHISSSRIRNGEIDKNGTHFYTRMIQSTPITLTKKIRPTFRKPFGEIYKGETDDSKLVIKVIIKYIKNKKLSPIISVGDDVTSSLLNVKKIPELSLVDLHVQRKRIYNHIFDHSWPKEIIHSQVRNPAGTITKNLIKTIKINLEKKEASAIEVIGEEDLAVLPCVLLAPLNSVVLYGHFQYGIVLVEVNDRKKQEALKLLYRLKG